MEWFEHQLLCNLKHRSVVVLDNAPYHNARTPESCNPTTAWKKADIQAWLSKRNIKFRSDLVKPELLAIAGRNKVDPVYKTDELAEKLGHRVLRLPPRHCELNPIELIQADLKGFVGRNNTTFKLEDVKKLFYQAKETITHERWAKAVQHVINDAEAHFSRVDCLDRPELEPVVISVDELDIEDDADEFDGINYNDEEELEDPISSDSEDPPSCTLRLPVIKSPAAQAALPGHPPEAMAIEPAVDGAEEDSVCGHCGMRDPSSGTGDTISWVFCDACDLWYHRSCERVPEGDLEGIYFCISCKMKLKYR